MCDLNISLFDTVKVRRVQNELQHSRESSEPSASDNLRRGDNHFWEFGVTGISKVIFQCQLPSTVARTVRQPSGY